MKPSTLRRSPAPTLLPDIHQFTEVTFSFAHTAAVPALGSLEAADYLPPDPARDCWLYLFREETGAVVFAHEVFVDANGEYHEAPLAVGRGRSPKLVPAGKALRVHASNLDARAMPQWAKYYVWATKVRVPPKLLPPTHASQSRAKGGATKSFADWARARDLDPVVFDGALEGGRLNQVIFPIWRKIEEAHDLLEAARHRFLVVERDPRFGRRLLLYLAVQALRREMSVDDCLDVGLLDAEHVALTKSQHLRQEAEMCATDLRALLTSSAWVALTDEIKAAANTDGIIWLADFLGDHAAPLEAFKSAHQDVDAIVKSLPYLPNDALSERDLKPFKSSRKGVKAYWGAVKGLMGGIERQNPGRTVRLVATAFEKMHGETIRPGIPGSGSAYHPEDIARIKRKLTDNKVVNFGLGALELANVLFAIADVKQVLTDAESSKKDKALKCVAALGALSSLGSAIASNAKLYVPDAYPKAIRDKLNRALREWEIGDPKWGGTLWGKDAARNARPFLSEGEVAILKAEELKLSRIGRAKFNLGYSDALKGGLNAAAGFADVIAGLTGGMEAFDFADAKSMAANAGIVVGGALGIIAGLCLAPGAAMAAGLAAVAALIGGASYIANVFLADDKIKTWLKFCSWGRERGRATLFGSQTSWLGGSPTDLYLDVDRQLETMEALIHELAIDWEHERMGGFFIVKYTARILFPESVIYMGVTADGDEGPKVVKPFSPVDESDTSYHYPPKAGSSERQMYFKYLGVRRVHVTLQIDQLGDRTANYPEKPKEKKFELGWR